MSAEETSTKIPQAIPQGKTRSPGLPGLVLIVSLCAIAAAVYAAWSARKQEGIEIEIVFGDGGGLQVGDTIRHRGVVVGEVTEIQLSEDLEFAKVKATLQESAKQLATSGTRYWIVRPEASLRGVSGLDTILAGQYIAVDPSRRKAERCVVFEGLDVPPAVQLPGNALEIVLEAKEIKGLQASAPILFRGLEVGSIQSIGLSPDSRWVRIYASIKPDYASLVRDNSVFWNSTGVKMNMGLSGFAFEAGALSTIALGGIEFATPEIPGSTVAMGHRFELFAEPNEDWEQWQTPIASGPGYRLEMQSLPMMQAAALKWTTSFYGFKRSQQRQGWVLTLSDGTIVGPADLFTVPAESVDKSVTFECAGKSWPIEQMSLRSSAQAKALRVHFPEVPSGPENWPEERLQKREIAELPDGNELILCEGNQRYIPLEEQSFKIEEKVITLSNKSALPKPVHGSTILDLSNRSVVAIVVADDEASEFVVVPIPD